MKKRLLSVLLTLSMVLTLLPSAAFAMEPDDQWAGYTAIDSQEDLEAIANDMSGKYYLTDDITLTGTWKPLGHGSSGEYDRFNGTPFTGVLDGDGHTISGLNTGTDFQTYAGVGLFAAVGQSGQIKNLTLNGANVYGRYWVGGFAGLNNGTIENCHLTDSTVAGHETGASNYIGGAQIGGIVGWNQEAGVVTGCSVTTSSVLGNLYVGGAVGVNNGQIEKSFVRDCVKEEGNWIGSKYYKDNYDFSQAVQAHVYRLGGGVTTPPYMYVGGLVGSNETSNGVGHVKNCYVTNTQINAIEAFGELIGVNWGAVTNCYTAENGLAYYSYYDDGYYRWYPDHASRNMYNSGGTVTGVHYYASYSLDLHGAGIKHYSGNGMKNQATYVDWDFENIWTLDSTATADNYGYPVFGTTVQPEAEKQIYVSFVDNNQTPIVDQVVIKAGESATAPTMDGNLPIIGWTRDDVKYEGGFSYAELEKLITVWGGTYENEGYLTFKAIYGDPIEKQIYVSFVDNNQTPIVDQVVIKAGESATAPTMDGNLPIIGWTRDDVKYEGGFSYAELEKLITVWGGTYENEGYLTFKAIYGDPIEKQIYVSFVDNNQTPIVDQVVIKAGESATAPTMDGNLPIIGWTRDDVKYEGGFSYAELEKLITVWGGTYENEGYLTFKAIYGDPIEKQIYVSFVDNNQTPIVDQVVIKAGESATAPTMDGNLPIIGWTRDDVKYEGGFSYAELEKLITVWGGTYENEGYLTFKAIYGDPIEKQIYVSFVDNNQTPIVDQVVIKAGESATAPTMDGNLPIIGWTRDDVKYEGGFSYAELEKLITVWGGTYENEGYLTFKAIYGDPIEKQIYVSFVDNNQTPIVDQVVIKAGESATAPTMDGNLPIIGWTRDDVKYEGGFSYAELEKLITVWGGTYENEGYLTFKAIYGDPIEKQIYVSFVDNNQTPIVDQVVIKAGESATAPTMDGNLPIIGWTRDDVKYEGGFSYAELEKLITVWGGTYENEGYLTFKAIYGDPIEKQIYVSFVDNNQTPIVDQVVIKAGESATAPTMDGNLPIIGWTRDDVKYEGGFSYAELEGLITVWGGTYENEGYLTFKAIYGDPIEKQIYVSFVDNNQTPIVDQVVIKAGESATAPIMDGNLPITGWMLNDVEYEGGFSYAELEELITVWGGTYENEGYLTFKAIYGDPIEKQIYVSFVDNNQTPIVDQVVIKAGESATAPTMDGNLPIIGWMLNDVEYEGGFSYAELEELITVWGGTYENEGYLTFKAIYGDPIEKQIYVSFVDNNQTPIVDQVVIKAGESATAPTMDGNLPIIGWTRDDVKYEGGFSYAELEGLITVWGGTYENEGYLTFKAIYGDPIEKQIYVSFVDNNQTPIVDQVVIKAGESATAPIMDGNLPITGWMLNDVEYEGGFSYAELEELITVWGGTYENEGYLTFKAIYGDPEPAQRTVTVTFQINASDDHGIYDSGRDVVTYTWDDMSAMITPPTVVCDEGYEHVGWVLNGATTTELTVPNIQVDPNLAYFAEGETTGYLTVYPVFKAVEAPQRTAIVTFQINASDDHGIYDSGRDVVTYTWDDMSAMITPPTVVCDEGYEHVGWVLNGATTTELTVPNIQVDPNLAYFAEGETTGYLTVYPVFKAVEAPQRTAIVTFQINASDDHGIYDSGRDVVTYTWDDMSAMITPPTVVCDEGYEHVGWVLNGATTTELTVPNIQVDPNLAYFAEGETTGYLTVYPVFKAVEAPQRTAIVTFQINASDDHGIYDSGRDVVTYTWDDMSAMITPPTVVCDEGYEHVGWVLNGATTTELTVPNIQVDPNLAYFAEGETTGYLTVYPVFKAVEAPQRTAIVTFQINASDDHGIYDSGRDVVTYTWDDMSAMITPPTVVCDEGYEHVGWVLNGATTTELTVPNIQVDPNLAYFAEGETTGYLTVYPVFKAVEAPQRTAIVTFQINASDDHGIYDSGRDVVTYTWDDMSAMITPPTVVCDEGYEHVGWVLNGATTTELTVPNIQVDPNLAYFAEGETTGYLTVYPVFKAVDVEEYRVIHVSFVDSDETTSLGGGDVISTYPDQELVTPDPAYFTPEDMTFAGWKVWVGNEPMYDGEFTYEALVQLLDNGFDGEQAWLTFEAVYTEKSPEYRVIHVSFVDSDETTSLGGGDVISTYPNQELVTPDPAYFTPEDMTFAGWKVWVGNEPMYDGEFTYEALVQLLDNGFDGEQAWLTFEAVYTEKAPEYRVIHVSFVDSDETTSLGGGDVISTYPNQELVTPDPAYFTPEDMTFAGWKVWVGNEPMYDGEFTYEALVQLLDNGFDGEQAWLTFEAVYTEKAPEYRVIHVSFVDSDETTSLGGGDVISTYPNQELVTPDPAYFTPEDMTFAGWKVWVGNEPMYDGEFTYEALVQLLDNGFDGEQAWLTFEAVYTEKAPEYRVIHVSFVDSDETTSLGGGDVISTYPNQELVTPDPAYFTPEDMTFVGWKVWVGNEPMYDGEFTYEALVQLLDNGFDGEQAWLTFEAVYTEKAPEYRVIHVSFVDSDETTSLGGGDVISTYPNQELVTPDPAYFTPEDMTFAGWKVWVGNEPMYDGEFTYEALVQLLDNGFDGEQAWLTFEAVYTEKSPEYRVIHVSFVDSDETTSLGGGDVISTYPDQELVTPDPAYFTPEDMTFAGWKVWVGNEPMYDGEFTYEALVQLLDNGFSGEEAWLTFEAVYKDEEPEPELEIADISVWKSVSDRYAEVGDTIWYSIRVKNTGDVRLFDVTVDDEMMGNDDRDIGTLDPGESWEDSYSYKVRSSDEGDTLVNEVYVTAETRDGSEVTAWDQVKTEIDEDDDRPRPPRPDSDDDKDDEDDKEDEEPEEVAEPEREYEPAYLNTEDHYAYITGYSDGTVRPLNDITRAEVATIFFRLLTDEARETYWSTISGYSDVSAGDWYNNAVSTLSNMGVIGGYPDGTFGPNDTISRAEFVAIATRFFDYTARYEGAFSDVSSAAWYADYIQAGVELGLVAGYPDGTFDPDGAISRAEACAIVNRVLGRVPHADYLLGWSVMVVWEDNQNTNAWYYADIQEATNSHDFQWIEEDGETVESWTEKLEERDWSALEEF